LTREILETQFVLQRITSSGLHILKFTTGIPYFYYSFLVLAGKLATLQANF